jgi:hypothetical protein
LLERGLHVHGREDLRTGGTGRHEHQECSGQSEQAGGDSRRAHDGGHRNDGATANQSQSAAILLRR